MPTSISPCQAYFDDFFNFYNDEERRVASFNVNGLKGKVDGCINILHQYKLDLLFLQETRLPVQGPSPHPLLVDFIVLTIKVDDNKNYLFKLCLFIFIMYRYK